MPIFISPKGNSEMWATKPEGYYTPEEWAAKMYDPVKMAKQHLEINIQAINDDLADIDRQSIEHMGNHTLESLEILARLSERAAKLKAQLKIYQEQYAAYTND